MKHYDVVAAIIFNDKKVLCTQRGINKYDYISNKYEFPGGKIEEGETKIDAIKREIREELKIDISIEKEYITVNHNYLDFELTMYTFICNSLDRSIILTEHIDHKWLKVEELGELDWAVADIYIVDKLMERSDE